MITKRRLALLTAMATTPVFAAPFLAIGDNAELFLTARTEIRYEDNVTFSPDTALDPALEDEILEFSPGVELLFGKNSLTKGSVSFYERFLAYSDHNVFNEELANFFFRSSYDGPKLNLSSNASFQELNQNSRDAALQGALVRRDVTKLGVSGELSVTEKSKVASGISYSKTDYKNGNFTDRKTYSVPVNYYFAITPKIDLSTGLKYTSTDVDAVDADSESFFYNVGARGEFTPKLTGSLKVGYSTRDPEVGDDSNTLGLDLALAYAYSLKTSFTFSASNDFQSSSNGGGQEVAAVGVGVTSSVSAGVNLVGNINYQQIDYIGDDREDDYITASIGVTYAVNEFMSLEAYYNYLDNSSDTADSEFTANIISIVANFRY